MAWVLVTGEDLGLYADALALVRAAGHAVVEAPDGLTALHLLAAVPIGMVALLKRRIGPMDVEDFLAAVAVDEKLRGRHAYVLLDPPTSSRPPAVERYLDELSILVVAPPFGAADTEGWGDVLDTIGFAARELEHASA